MKVKHGEATHDEAEFTPGATPGEWTAWDARSPEYEFCLFVGVMQRMLAPHVIVETGVGAGRVTHFLNLNGCEYLGFEADYECQTADWITYQAHGVPQGGHMAAADLVILDSGVNIRCFEIPLWESYGKRGSVCIVHDALTRRHPAIYDAIIQTGLLGMWLANPRGAWMAVHP